MHLHRLLLLSGLSLFVLGSSTSSLSTAQRAYTVAASQMEHRIDINKLECVSRVPNGAVIFEQDFYLNPTVPDIVRSAWPGKQVALDDAQCPYGLYFTIISQTTRAVTYLGKPSKVFMSFQVCRRNADGRVDFNPCSYKNLYLFESGVKPLEAFEIGLRAFLRAQNEDWVVLTIQPENLGGGQ